MVLVGSCEEEEEESVGDLGQSSLPESQSGNETEDEPDANCKDWPALEGAVALDSAQTDRDGKEGLEVGEEKEKEEEEEEEEGEEGETAEELGRARCSCIMLVIHHCSCQCMNVAVCQTVPLHHHHAQVAVMSTFTVVFLPSPPLPLSLTCSVNGHSSDALLCVWCEEEAEEGTVASTHQQFLQGLHTT